MAEVTQRNILRKITVKTCEAKPDIEALIEYKKEHGENAVMPVLAVYGIASDYKVGQTDDAGEFVKFFGQFKAVRPDGKQFVSGACILPGAASDLVYGALKGLSGTGTVEFAFRVGVKWDKDAATKYVYVVEQLVNPKEADPLVALESRLGTAAPLPAPQDEKANSRKR